MVALEVKVLTAAENSTPPAIASSKASNKSQPVAAATPRGKVTMKPAPTDVSLQLRVPNPSTATRLNKYPSSISEGTPSEVSVITKATGRHIDKHCIMGTCAGKRISGRYFSVHVSTIHKEVNENC
jgi:hypothetical protein